MPKRWSPKPTVAGCRIRIRPVGVFLMEDQERAEHKILGEPLRDPVWSNANSLDDVRAHLLTELEHFFAVYRDLEENKKATLGWEDAPMARHVIDRVVVAAS